MLICSPKSPKLIRAAIYTQIYMMMMNIEMTIFVNYRCLVAAKEFIVSFENELDN